MTVKELKDWIVKVEKAVGVSSDNLEVKIDSGHVKILDAKETYSIKV